MRRRIRVPDDRSSHERWLVSWADFITLLFAFFVVLFASAYRDTQAMSRLAMAIHNGFETLGVFSDGTHHETLADRPHASTPMPDTARVRQATPGASPDMLELRRELQNAVRNELRDQEVELRVTPEGFVISLHELGFFNSGQAVLLPGAAAKIERIARILARDGLELRIEGHSDNQPIHNAQFKDNWELSTARAMTVLLLLVNEAGYDPSRISVSGYAQYRPIADETTSDGRRRNRRVDLVVLGERSSR